MKISSNRSIRWLAYRVVRRFAIANICYFYQTPIDKMPRTPTPDGYTIRSCSSKQIRDHASELDDAIPERDLQMLDAGKSKCFAAFHGESLAGFAWAAFENIPAEMNHDGKPETGLPIQLASESAFIFQVLVLPQHRGRRLYATILSQMADELQSNRIRHLVLTTEASNCNALRAVERMRFQKVGQASLFRIGPLSRATYPVLPNMIGFSVGRYVGDNRSPDST